MSELVKWLISVVVAAVVVIAAGLLFFMYPLFLMSVVLFIMFLCWVCIAKMLLFEMWQL